MKKKLTTKQTLFANHYVLGKSGKDAAILAGYSEKSARFTASHLLTNDNILQHIEEILDQAGLSDQKLAQRLQQAIDAGLEVKATNADAIKGIKMAYQLKNKFSSTKTKIDISSSVSFKHIELELSKKTPEEYTLLLGYIQQKTDEYRKRLNKDKTIIANTQ